MSHDSSYKPNSGFERWMDERLPIIRLGADFATFPTPRNLNYFWTFGGILTFCLATQIITGIVLAMHYIPDAAQAFDSVERIRRDVPSGWLIQPIHMVGASMFFVAVYIHMFRGLEARRTERHRAESGLSPDKRLSGFDFNAVPTYPRRR